MSSRSQHAKNKAAFFANHERKVMRNAPRTPEYTLNSCLDLFDNAYGFKSKRSARRASNGAAYKPRDIYNVLAYGKSKAKAKNLVEYPVFMADYMPSTPSKRKEITEGQYYAPRPAIRLKDKNGMTRGVKKAFSKS